LRSELRSERSVSWRREPTTWFAGASRGAVVDLSVTLSESLPCAWPGHMPFARRIWSWFEEVDLPVPQSCCSLGPYHTSFLMLDEHCGTHLDGPTHFIPPPESDLPWAGPLGSLGGDRLDLARMMGPAAVIDVRSLAEEGEPGRSPAITTSHLRSFESRHGRLRPGDAVLLCTGWSRHYVREPEGGRFVRDPVVTGSGRGWPALDPDAAIMLSSRGVVVVGIDAPSMGSVQDGAPVHQEGLSRGLLFVEMLTGLEALPARGAFFVFLPLKIAGSSGGPGRAIALLGGREQANRAEVHAR
jgi:kynurenine formamidase